MSTQVKPNEYTGINETLMPVIGLLLALPRYQFIPPLTNESLLQTQQRLSSKPHSEADPQCFLQRGNPTPVLPRIEARSRSTILPRASTWLRAGGHWNTGVSILRSHDLVATTPQGIELGQALFEPAPLAAMGLILMVRHADQ